MTKIKICGITNLKDALTAVDLGADALGFVFYKKSPRYILPSKAKDIISKIPASVWKVGVFVNGREERVKAIAKLCRLSYLQFHGDETPQFCRRFNGYKIIKAFRISRNQKPKDIKNFKVDAYLFDTFAKNEFGGTGKTFNWKLLKSTLKLKKPIILSGGLNAKNIRQAIKNVRPFCVDISSGVESSPGKKSQKLLKELFRKINSRQQ